MMGPNQKYGGRVEERIIPTQKTLNEKFETFTSKNSGWGSRHNSTEIKVAKPVCISWGPDPVSFCHPENINMNVWDFAGGSVF